MCITCITCSYHDYSSRRVSTRRSQALGETAASGARRKKPRKTDSIHRHHHHHHPEGVVYRSFCPNSGGGGKSRAFRRSPIPTPLSNFFTWQPVCQICIYIYIYIYTHTYMYVYNTYIYIYIVFLHMATPLSNFAGLGGMPCVRREVGLPYHNIP